MTDVLLFGSLSMDLEPHWRQRALHQQTLALQAALANEGSTGDSVLPTILRLQANLRNADRRARQAASQLLAAPLLWETGLDHELFTDLLAARRDAWEAEARMQCQLGQLTVLQWQRIEALLQHDASAGDQVCQMVVTRAGVREYLQGVLVLSPIGRDDPPSQPILLLWPGSGGGLQSFASRQALWDALLGTSGEQVGEFEPVAGPALRQGLRAQWQNIQGRASDIMRGERWYEDAPGVHESLERLRREALEDLTVSLHPARTQALGLILEEQRSALLSQELPDWWQRLTQVDRLALGETLIAYVGAQRASEALISRDLPARDEMVARQIEQQVNSDFKPAGVWDIRLDVPLSVRWVKQFIAGSGAPGTPTRLVPEPSRERVSLTLAELALDGIDEQMRLRLDDLQVHVEASHPATGQMLRQHIDKAWLIRTVAALDVAQAYEDALAGAFLGMPSDTSEQARQRRATVAAPWRYRLQWQASAALCRRRLSEKGWQMVQCALVAQSAEDWRPDGWQLRLCSAALSSGRWAGLNRDWVALAGVMLIEEQITGTTVVYLPDAPHGLDFCEYPSVSAACAGIAEMSNRNDVLDYLSERPLEGAPAAHAGYMHEAGLRRFDKFIKAGPAWPVTTSLAQHLANVHMGRLLESHRSSSRSQRDLALEASAVAHGAVFNHIKMALGLVPFVGVAISVYDGWVGANAAVEAFLNGEPGEGMDHIESVLLCLVDAAMDVLPGMAATGGRSGAIARTRSRQRHALLPTIRRARQPFVSPLEGYQSDVSLTGLAQGTEGRYLGIYRHAQGDFIWQDGRACQVEWDTAQAIWRLKGTSRKGYRQPIVLDDFQQWTTYGALTGQLVPSGAGGGAYLGRLVREGWAGLAGMARRQLAVAETEAARTARLQEAFQRNLARQDAVAERVQAALEGHRRQPGVKAFKQVLNARLEAFEYFRELSEQGFEVLGPRPARPAFQRDMKAVVDNALTHSRAVQAVHLQDTVLAVEEMKAAAWLPERFNTEQAAAAQARLEIAFVKVHEAATAALAHRVVLESWAKRLRAFNGARPYLATLESFLNHTPSALDHKSGLIGVLSTLAIDTRSGTLFDVRYFVDRYSALRSGLVRSSIAYRELKSGKLVLSLNERHQVLESVVKQFRRFEVHAQTLQSQNPHMFTSRYWQELLGYIAEFLAQVRAELLPLEQSLTRMSQAKAAARTGGTSTKRVFETVDDTILVGTGRTTSQGVQQIDIADPVSGQVVETFSEQASGKWQSTTPRGQPATVLPADLPQLLATARQALDDCPALVRRAEDYARLDSDPLDLEDLLVRHADRLTRHATDVGRLAADQASGLLTELERQAATLKAEGTRLRVAQTKLSTPTASRLAYLLERGEARIEKVGERQGLRNARGRIVDYLQEYVVRDTANQQPLWYAHFHYERAASAFEAFTTAHLKTVEQRRLGRQSQMLQEQSGQTVTPLLRERLYGPFARLHFAAVDR
jgi:hypothetical protein